MWMANRVVNSLGAINKNKTKNTITINGFMPPSLHFKHNRKHINYSAAENKISQRGRN